MPGKTSFIVGKYRLLMLLLNASMGLDKMHTTVFYQFIVFVYLVFHLTFTPVILKSLLYIKSDVIMKLHD